jgi:poly-beta-1,6-N-acetyl-D-glucosamine synthase
VTYAVITPARDELENLRRLAACMVEQSSLPAAWIVVDDGSVDGTADLARELARKHRWIHVVSQPRSSHTAPGTPVVRAFNLGLAELPGPTAVVVKLDADVSLAPTYFERLLEAFAAQRSLGIASGTCLEWNGARWEETFVTGAHVRGAARAYRWECLKAVSPLEERMGWDSIDQLKANVLGWDTCVLRELPFYHHRAVGERDGPRGARWSALGESSYYMGYRFSYLVLRALHRARRDPAALRMIGSYVAAAVRRRPRYSSSDVRDRLREQQRLRNLPRRLREARGIRPIQEPAP